jgi:prepilin-type processing-associated H-X9-DG protein
MPAQPQFYLRLKEGMCADFDIPGFSDASGTAPAQPGSLAAGSAARIDQVRRILEAGYGTNYASSWFHSRGGILSSRNTATNDTTTHAIFDAKGLGGTLGPLTRRQTESQNVPSANIPLIGDSAPGDAKEAILSDAIQGFDLPAGARLGESFNDGPGYWTGSKLSLISKGYVITPAPTSSSNCAWCDDVLPTPSEPQDNTTGGGADGRLWLQDTRDWFASHGAGKSASANILMADGSVKVIKDVNGDGFLNPGFPIVKGTADQNDGFLDNTVELAPFEVYGGPEIRKLSTSDKGNFE